MSWPLEAEEEELGEGDRCTVRRKEGRLEAELLRNHSYGESGQSLLRRVAP